jgi:hypothetical protein
VTQIAFAEETQGRQQNETSYNGPLITVGRNPATCQIVFDQKQCQPFLDDMRRSNYEMAGGFYQTAVRTYGTFLDGQPVKEPTPLRVKSRVQFGSGGPVLLVTRIENKPEVRLANETVADPRRAAPLAMPRQAQQPNVQSRPPAALQRPPNESVFVELSGERALLLAAAQCGKARPFRKRSLTSFPEAEPQEKVIKGNSAESHRHSHCAAASRYTRYVFDVTCQYHRAVG